MKCGMLLQGLGTDEYSLIGLLCVRTNDELDEMKALYKESMMTQLEIKKIQINK